MIHFAMTYTLSDGHEERGWQENLPAPVRLPVGSCPTDAMVDVEVEVKLDDGCALGGCNLGCGWSRCGLK